MEVDAAAEAMPAGRVAAQRASPAVAVASDTLLTTFVVRCAHQILLSAVTALLELDPNLKLFKDEVVLMQRAQGNCWLGLVQQVRLSLQIVSWDCWLGLQ